MQELLSWMRRWLSWIKNKRRYWLIKTLTFLMIFLSYLLGWLTHCFKIKAWFHVDWLTLHIIRTNILLKEYIRLMIHTFTRTLRRNPKTLDFWKERKNLKTSQFTVELHTRSPSSTALSLVELPLKESTTFAPVAVVEEPKNSNQTKRESYMNPSLSMIPTPSKMSMFKKSWLIIWDISEWMSS